MIRTSIPECPYYLAELIDDVYTTVIQESDEYGHKIPPNERVAKCQYLEKHKETRDGILYYKEENKQALISAYCMVGIYPRDITRVEKRRGKEQEMLFVNNVLHISLCELLNYDM